MPGLFVDRFQMLPKRPAAWLFRISGAVENCKGSRRLF
jgi:hypothetical protein